jgi:hypothetical protein|tara:strand:+ start:325 stop:717 length:393 start_codon:yes stop_codon:yes gene_type:complete
MASQTITGPELQYTQDNKHCFAYSGAIGVSNSETDLLNFHSKSAYIVATFQFGPDEYDTDDYRFRVRFNGIIVLAYLVPRSDYQINNPLNLIIPPNTEVRATAENLDADDANRITTTITGRVYEYLPVRN